jgi:hypothetical protein
VVLGLRLLVGAREDSRERGGEVFGSVQGARYGSGSAIEFRSFC